MGQTAKLVLPEKTVELPIVEGSEGEKGINIVHLRKETGYITLDPGYLNTGSCKSAITFIDGEKGILRYRGYPIEQLAVKRNFLEVSYLLINGKLPDKNEFSSFSDSIVRNMQLHEFIKRLYDGYPRDAHPMAILISVVAAASTLYQNEEGSPEEVSYLNSLRLMGKLPAIAACAYKKSLGQPFMYPRFEDGYCRNFLRMMFGTPCADFEVDEELEDALNLLLILHADHEQNCSTSTVRGVRSSNANMYASIAAGIAALWGSRHGGANQRVIEMLENIKAGGGNAKKYVEKAKDRSDAFRLFGFGHRVYKNFDPRSKILKESCDRFLNKTNRSDALLDIAKELEEIALKDEYFIERKLYPNVDFYSGLMFRAMGIPVDAFTVMFAIGRLPGWISQAKELTEEEGNKISRPRQIYTGETLRDVP